MFTEGRNDENNTALLREPTPADSELEESVSGRASDIKSLANENKQEKKTQMKREDSKHSVVTQNRDSNTNVM